MLNFKVTAIVSFFGGILNTQFPPLKRMFKTVVNVHLSRKMRGKHLQLKQQKFLGERHLANVAILCFAKYVALFLFCKV